MSETLKIKKKKGKVMKLIGIIFSVIIILLIGAYFYITSHTQIIVGAIQKSYYKDSSPNSYQPLNAPGEGVMESGKYLIHDVAYSTKYPNSYLDITYPDTNTEIDRPTLVYFHGGGFFAGNKASGDPLAVSESNALLDDLGAEGYNIVNVDYALVPDYHFPTPLIQMNEAIRFIDEHKEEYHINMENVILMGSSAGAIMVAQYATIVSNPEYATLLDIEPLLSKDQISAVVVDDGPIDYKNMTLMCKMLVGNYVKGSIYLNQEEVERYECIPYMTADYPAAFMLGSEYRNDMISMHNRLQEVGVENILVDPLAEDGEEKPHCFVASERVDRIAKKAFDRLTAYLKEKTKNDESFQKSN